MAQEATTHQEGGDGSQDAPVPTRCPYCKAPLHETKKANGTVELRCVKPTQEGPVRAHGINMYIKARK